MPCDSVTLQSIALSKALPDLLAKALVSLGWRVELATNAEVRASNDLFETVLWKAGTGITVQSAQPEPLLANINKAYGVQAVTWAAQRSGWTVNQTALDKISLSRR